MFGKLIGSLAASGIYFAFAAHAWAYISNPGPYTITGMWWGLLVATVAGYFYTLKLIWECPTNA